MTFARDARVRIFRELLPRINERTLPALVADPDSDRRYDEYCATIAELAREAQVAGRPEREAMREVFLLNTGSSETGDHGTFTFQRAAVIHNHEGIRQALLKMGYAVAHRIR
jgi:hypothetical protein